MFHNCLKKLVYRAKDKEKQVQEHLKLLIAKNRTSRNLKKIRQSSLTWNCFLKRGDFGTS